MHQAEVLSTPFPGIVLAARAGHHTCIAEGCPFTYRVRVTNPTDRDANVQTCTAHDPTLTVPVMGIAGLWVKAGATKTYTTTFYLKLDKSAAKTLVGRDLTCTGLDWHGHAPI